MNIIYPPKKNITNYLLTLCVLIFFALVIKFLKIETSCQDAGLVNFSLGFILLVSYITSKILKLAGLPLISSYILTGIAAGPYVSGFLDSNMIERLRLIDDLALNFIALTAGGALHIKFLRARFKAIALNIALNTVVVFLMVFCFVIFSGSSFNLTRNLSAVELTAIAVLLGVIAIARSPSSAIAIISECNASGPFTETVLGVTVAIDVLIIIFFTFAMTVAKTIMAGGQIIDYQAFAALSLEMAVSLIIGAIIGKGIAVYIERAGHDLALFLLAIAFGVAKASISLSAYMENHFDISLHIEPLLICMSAGFTVQNFSKAGNFFMESLERFAMPIYLIFFSLAGASLNFEALIMCWSFALCFAIVRGMGIFGGTWLAGTISGYPAAYNRHAWMAYLTQAGVAIGLAQLAQRQFPEIGVYLSTIVLAVISLNQIVGPVTFKFFLNIAGEAKKKTGG